MIHLEEDNREEGGMTGMTEFLRYLGRCMLLLSSILVLEGIYTYFLAVSIWIPITFWALATLVLLLGILSLTWAHIEHKKRNEKQTWIGSR